VVPNLVSEHLSAGVVEKTHKCQLLFGSAKVLDERFLYFLKTETRFQESIVALVVDKSHNIETWTTKKGYVKLIYHLILVF
jgi:hypothetical protein